MRRAALALAPALLALLAPGCALDRMAADAMVPVLVRTKDLANQDTNARWVREAAPGLLATLDGIVASSPENPELRLLQAEMNAALAFAFLEQEDPALATSLYRKARGAALVAVADEDEDLADALASKPVPAVSAILAEADEDLVPALFWWAFARGAEVNLNRGDTTLVAELARVDVVMTWVLEKDEAFFNGGPHLYFAMRNLALPPSFGGKPEKGLYHFDKVDGINAVRVDSTGGVLPGLLMARVLRAQFHAPTLAATPAGAKMDQVLAAQKAAWHAYFDVLDAVVKSDPMLWPAQALSNAVARERALALLRDPEANNIITPQGVENPYKPAPEPEGWGGGGEAGDDAGGWDAGAAGGH